MRIVALNLLALLLSVAAGCQSTSTGRVNSSDRAHSFEVVLPANAPSIKSDYGARRSVSQRYKRPHPHRGIDIVAPRGHPVLAPYDGMVSLAGSYNEPGLKIIINHRTPDGLPMTTSYLHLSKLNVVFGQKVTRGQKIGEVGQTGTTSDDVNHLHFAVNGGRDNPHRYWIGGEGVIECFEANRTYRPHGNALFTYPVACIDFDQARCGRWACGIGPRSVPDDAVTAPVEVSPRGGSQTLAADYES